MGQESVLGVVSIFFNNFPRNSTYRPWWTLLSHPSLFSFQPKYFNLFSLVLYYNLQLFVLLSWMLSEFF